MDANHETTSQNVPVGAADAKRQKVDDISGRRKELMKFQS
jgi:hypothetical protein